MPSCRGPSGPDLEGQLADCDPKLAKYWAALDAGADPARNWLQGDRHDRVSRQWTRPWLSVIASQLLKPPCSARRRRRASACVQDRVRPDGATHPG